MYLLLSLTLYVCHFVSPYEISEVILILSECAISLFHLSSSFSLTFLCFTQKFDCGIIFTSKSNLVLSVIIIITMLVKLLLMIWSCVTSYVVCQSVLLSDFVFERYVS